MTTPETIRAAAYLVTRERMDLRGKGPKCKPPNRPCGDRCIPPNWKCRVKGEGTDGHSRAVAADPLAGAASIARGRARLEKGLRTGNLTEIQAGRAAIARGLVKAVPGQNLKQKQDLRKRVEGAIVPVATGLFAVWALRQGHEGAKVLFPAYARGLGKDVEEAAGSAIGFVLDRVPIYGGLRQAQRKNAAIQAQFLGRALRVGVTADPTTTRSGQDAFTKLDLRKLKEVNQAISQSINQVKDENGKVAKTYQQFRSDILSNVVGAASEGKSVFAEPAAINLMAKQFSIQRDKILGADTTAKKTYLINRVESRLAYAAESMKSDMAVRGLNHRKPEDVERYSQLIRLSAEKSFVGLNSDQKEEALKSFNGLVRDLVTPSASRRPHRRIAASMFNELVGDSESGYTKFFRDSAKRIKEDTSPTLRVQVASSPDSPVRASLITVAEKVKGKVKLTAPIAGANHAELVLQRVYHEYAIPGQFKKDSKATWTASNTDIKYAAQDLGWDGQGGLVSAYNVLRQSGQFPNLAPPPSASVAPAPRPKPALTGQVRNATRVSDARRIASMMRQKNPDGTPRYASREAAEAALRRMRNPGTDGAT